jgi:hypothetical protein
VFGGGEPVPNDAQHARARDRLPHLQKALLGARSHVRRHTSFCTEVLVGMSSRGSSMVLVALLGLAGCAAPPPAPEGVDTTTQAENDGQPRDALAASVAAGLLAQSVITAGEAPMLVPLGTESGFTVMMTPGLPSPTARLLMVAAGQPGASTSSPTAHFTTDAWSTSTDVAGTVYTVDGAPVVVFQLAAALGFPAATYGQVALDVGGTWLNHGSANYAFSVVSTGVLSFVGATRAGQDGLLRTIPGDSLYGGHDTAVTLETYPMLPNSVATLHWTSDGYTTVHDVPMALSAINTGTYGDDARWAATLPTAVLSAGTAVAYWADATSNGPGGDMWDSNGGANFTASVAAAPAPTWAQLGAYEFYTTMSGWTYGFQVDLPDPLSANPGDYQAYAAGRSPAVEVYVPGVTDAPGGAAACSGGFVLVEAWSPFFSGQPTGAWASYPLPFDEVSGNNCRFKWTLQYSGFTQPPPGVDYPAGGNYPDDGTYAYKLRISTDGGSTWAWLGTGGLPDGGDNRSIEWVAPYHGG